MRKALIVGLNAYPDYYRLDCCNNDADAIAELIELNGDGSRNFDVERIIDKCDEEFLHNSIDKLYKDDSEIALLYFSGHGADVHGGYLCTTDMSQNKFGVKMTDILEIVNNSCCKNKVIILDCCFAAKMGESLLLHDKSILGEGVTIIAASKAWQLSKEDKNIGHGVFTKLLIEGLKGGAADIRGNITPASLYSFVDQSLGAWDQRPVFKTNISQFLPLRTIQPKVSDEKLRKLKEYFINPTYEFKLDPSYEFTNSPEIEHDIIEPYADKLNVAVFNDLQLFESVGLIEPVGTPHMYFAAMKNKSCKLTELGRHYWRLSNDKRF